MTIAATTEDLTFESAEMLAQHVAAWLCALAQADGRGFSVWLSGGSTPRGLYEQIATPAIASAVGEGAQVVATLHAFLAATDRAPAVMAKR